MRYKLIEGSTNNYTSESIKEDILKSRGVENPLKYLNLKSDVEIPFSKLNDINRAVECLLKHLDNNDIIYLQVDNDVDGMASASSLYLGIKEIYPNARIYWDIQDGKAHGLNLKQIPKGTKLVIIPDAGSNQYEEHRKLDEKGVDCIVLDHHEVDKESKYAIIVNNQLSSNYPNKALSGVGIVYKFLQALDDELWLNNADNYLDLVALGNIADMMDIRSLETRYYINKGLNNINNIFFKQLINKQQYSIQGKLNPITVGFYIAPLINGMVRMGKQEDKKLMFKAFIGENEYFKYTPRKSKNNPEPKEIEENIYEHVARLCASAKGKQDRLKEKSTKLIEEDIANNKLSNNKLLIVNVTGKLESTMTGLIANEIAKKYMKPCILLKEKKENKKDKDAAKIFTGSIRGLDDCELIDFKGFLNSLNICDWVEGHANAAGIQIKEENISKLIKKSNSELKNINFDKIYLVDYIIPFEELSDDLIEEIYDMNNIWGQKLHESLIAIENINIKTNNVKLIGDKKDTISFSVEGINFIKFKSTDEEYNSLIGSEDGWGRDLENVTVDVVGKCSVNDYKGNRKYQIVIKDFNIK